MPKEIASNDITLSGANEEGNWTRASFVGNWTQTSFVGKRPTNLRHDQKPIRQKMEIRLVFLTSKNEYSLHKGLNLIHGASKSYSFVYRA